jgi:nucleotide-binding universal stress UspA family protein
MIKHILVPLDGSHLAESVLPVASFLAEKMRAAVTLLHLLEHNPPATVHGDRHLTTTQDAETYLSDLAGHAFPKTVKAEWHVHTVEVTNVPSSIVEHSGEMGSNLVILCTHGQTGLRDLLVGSIAQQVVSLGRTPVLLLPPSSGEMTGFLCKNILVALDGKPEHELGLPIALEVARACDASLEMVMAVPTLETMSQVLDLAEEEAHAYLAGLIQAQAETGVSISATVQRGDPVDILMATAPAEGADLLVLATHGRKGPGAFWSGSVAPKVILRTKTPLLLVRAPGEPH